MKRSDLYRAVWAEPVFHVAKKLGVSDRGLAEVCRRADVPTPPRGHWRKVKTGQAISPPALPNPEVDPDLMIDGKSPSPAAEQQPLDGPGIAPTADSSISVVEAELAVLNKVGTALIDLGKLKSTMGPEVRTIARRWLTDAVNGI